MKLHARKAYTALKKLGVPVFKFDTPDAGEHFKISAEGEDDKATGLPWADYWMIGALDRDHGYEFGVSPKIMRVLGVNGLFAEWENPGVLGVYDA